MSNTSKKFFTNLILSLLLVSLYLGYKVFFIPAQQTTPEPQVAGASTSQVSPTFKSQSSDFEVYFTSPIRPFSGNTQNSIEYQLIKKINSAQNSLHLAIFEFDLESIALALINAHNRGVEVQVVYDDEYSNPDPQIKELISSGIETVPDKRSAFMHNKFVVVDNQCVWTGSFNITVNAAYKNNENAVYICDPKLAINYQTEFSEMFNGQFGPTSPSDTPYPILNISGTEIENYFAPEDNVMEKVIAAVQKAKTFVHFLAFSFTDKELANTMINLQKNGVTISGVFETRGSNSESSECKNFLAARSDVRLDGNPYTLHDKIIIIDSESVILGSFNFSANANKSNDENLLIIHNKALAQRYEQEFQKLFSQAKIPSSLTCDN